MRIVDEGIISLRSERNAYMPGIELLSDGSFIAGQFTASYFTASDAKIEILRSTDGLSTWTNEGEVKGAGAAGGGLVVQGRPDIPGPRWTAPPEDDALRYGPDLPDLRRRVRDPPAAGEHHPLVRRRRPHMVRAAARRCPDRSVEAHRQRLRRPAPDRPGPLDVPSGNLEAGRLRRPARPEGPRPFLLRPGSHVGRPDRCRRRYQRR